MQNEIETSQAFEAYQMYLAIQRHFTTKSYDYFKYKGKVKVSSNSFMKRKDRYYFWKLSHKKEKFDMLVSSFGYNYNKKLWIGDIMADVGKDSFNRWIKFNSSEYQYKIDMENFNKFSDFSGVNNEEKFPNSLNLLLQEKINPETIILTNLATGDRIFKHWDEKLCDNILWQELGFHLKKFQQFFNNHDIEKYKLILKEKY